MASVQITKKTPNWIAVKHSAKEICNKMHFNPDFEIRFQQRYVQVVAE